MPNGWGSILISGGSVEVRFDEALFHKIGDNKFSNPNRKIVRAQIRDAESGSTFFDSGQNLDGLKWTIEIETK